MPSAQRPSSGDLDYPGDAGDRVVHISALGIRISMNVRRWRSDPRADAGAGSVRAAQHGFSSTAPSSPSPVLVLTFRDCRRRDYRGCSSPRIAQFAVGRFENVAATPRHGSCRESHRRPLGGADTRCRWEEANRSSGETIPSHAQSRTVRDELRRGTRSFDRRQRGG